MTAGRKSISTNKDWCTPSNYVEAIHNMLGKVSLDPCSNKYSLINAKTEYILPVDGLLESWNFPTIYVNPPYGSDKKRGTTVKDWLKKCSEAHKIHCSQVLALIPVATNTRYWQKYIWGGGPRGVCFLYDTRLKFLLDGKEGGKGEPMGCAMIYWGSNFYKFSIVFKQFGKAFAL